MVAAVNPGAGAAPCVAAGEVLAGLWSVGGLPAPALSAIDLPGSEPVLPSSFPVATAAQAALGAAALAAAELWHLRQRLAGRPQPRQRVLLDKMSAACDSRGYFRIDGKSPPSWDKFSGLYRCAGGTDSDWVRIHTNFAHHRDGVLRLLECPPADRASRDDVAAALRHWRAIDFEQAAADAGLVVAATRSFAQWDAHPQGLALAGQPVLWLERIGDAAPRAWAPIGATDRPLAGLRVLDLTRILAGPVAGRTLAAYGADVLLVNSPNLPNIEAIADTSRGKLSALVDLDTRAGVDQLHGLLRDAQVFVQGYRPGGLAARGFDPLLLAQRYPGIVQVSLSAYGHLGPWAGRRGFDSLVQTATGFNLAEQQAAGDDQPRPLPMQILDYCAGYLMAFGAQAALWHQATEGGSWQVRVSLAGVGHWLRTLGRVHDSFGLKWPDFAPLVQSGESGFGLLESLPHAAQFSVTPAGWSRPSMPPGSHPPRWP